MATSQAVASLTATTLASPPGSRTALDAGFLVGNEASDRASGAADDDLLAGLDAIQQPGEMCLGFVHVDLIHMV
jgi:hypothetical protein